ncbi:hypothetical protein AMAG_11552 [Allomyces macrogynus ATCC 38327]|uniref:RING-type domain-containing protein n=1 Tax=Allomyces macrogynus (strain ATCC 38327) TaxID=578462 RepID=A0A0L0SVB5_ALLM3|nr:hypothetical protein, variant [Allomyces macrogynus ATCC 38327]KNE66412.1 hypothetical protein AMAG_11552 [Allomyces macrogynus ATCC 38327]|eukprot:KNE66411.1 hypothetical protein, variant [Allomyces macrogynus ATCC 38327]
MLVPSFGPSMSSTEPLDVPEPVAAPTVSRISRTVVKVTATPVTGTAPEPTHPAESSAPLTTSPPSSRPAGRDSGTAASTRDSAADPAKNLLAVPPSTPAPRSGRRASVLSSLSATSSRSSNAGTTSPPKRPASAPVSLWTLNPAYSRASIPVLTLCNQISSDKRGITAAIQTAGDRATAAITDQLEDLDHHAHAIVDCLAVSTSPPQAPARVMAAMRELAEEYAEAAPWLREQLVRSVTKQSVLQGAFTQSETVAPAGESDQTGQRVLPNEPDMVAAVKSVGTLVSRHANQDLWPKAAQRYLKQLTQLVADVGVCAVFLDRIKYDTARLVSRLAVHVDQAPESSDRAARQERLAMLVDHVVESLQGVNTQIARILDAVETGLVDLFPSEEHVQCLVCREILIDTVVYPSCAHRVCGICAASTRTSGPGATPCRRTHSADSAADLTPPPAVPAPAAPLLTRRRTVSTGTDVRKSTSHGLSPTCPACPPVSRGRTGAPPRHDSAVDALVTRFFAVQVAARRRAVDAGRDDVSRLRSAWRAVADAAASWAARRKGKRKRRGSAASAGTVESK